MGASRALFGLNNLSLESAKGNVKGAGDALWSLGDGAVPELGMAYRIVTFQAKPTDALILLYLLNIKAGKGKPPAEEPNSNSDKDGNTNTPEEDGVQSKGSGGDKDGNTSSNKEGVAYEGKGETPPLIPEWKGPTDYSGIDTNKFKIKEGADFTPAQKKAIYEANMEHNDGLLRSDLDGTVLEMPQKKPTWSYPITN